MRTLAGTPQRPPALCQIDPASNPNATTTRLAERRSIVSCPMR